MWKEIRCNRELVARIFLKSRYSSELRNPVKVFTSSLPRGKQYSDAIFKRHNMKSIGYWTPEDAPSSQSLFVYILEHPSHDEAKKNWDAFHDDPDWKKVKAESETQGPLVDHIDNYFMDPTRYSALN